MGFVLIQSFMNFKTLWIVLFETIDQYLEKFANKLFKPTPPQEFYHL